VLPSAERVILRLKKPPSEVHSIIRAAPSHLALVFAVLPMTSCSVSLPSVVYLAGNDGARCGVDRAQSSTKFGSLWSILIKRFSGPLPANLLFSRFIFHAPLKSGLVCALAIEAQRQTIAAIISAARFRDFMVPPD